MVEAILPSNIYLISIALGQGQLLRGLTYQIDLFVALCPLQCPLEAELLVLEEQHSVKDIIRFYSN